MAASNALTLTQLPGDVLLLILAEVSHEDKCSLSQTCAKLCQLARRDIFRNLRYSGQDYSLPSLKLGYIAEHDELRSLVRTLEIERQADRSQDPSLPQFHGPLLTILDGTLRRLDRLSDLTLNFEDLSRAAFISLASHPSLAKLSSSVFTLFDCSILDLPPPPPTLSRRKFIHIARICVGHTDPARNKGIQRFVSQLRAYGFLVGTLHISAETHRSPDDFPLPETLAQVRHLVLDAHADGLNSARTWFGPIIAALPQLKSVALRYEEDLDQDFARQVPGQWIPTCSSEGFSTDGQAAFIQAWLSSEPAVAWYHVKWVSEPAPAIVELKLRFDGAGLKTTSDFEALVAHLPDLIKLDLDVGTAEASMISDWNDVVPLFARLPALQQLTLRTHLGPTPGAAVLSCSSDCWEELVRTSDEGETLRETLNSIFGCRVFNALWMELNLARLRQLAAYLPHNATVHWTMLEDHSVPPPSFTFENPEAIDRVPEYEGRVQLDDMGQRTLDLVRKELGPCSPPQNQAEDEANGRCFGCMVRVGYGDLFDPKYAIRSDFSLDELVAAASAVEVLLKAEEMAEGRDATENSDEV